MDTQLQEAYAKILEALLNFAILALNIGLPVLVAYGVRIVHLKAAELKAKLAQENAYLVDVGTRIVVKAAEQLKDSKEIADKKKYAIGLLDEWLKARGVTLPLAELSAKIEAVVWSEFNDPALED